MRQIIYGEILVFMMFRYSKGFLGYTPCQDNKVSGQDRKTCQPMPRLRLPKQDSMNKVSRQHNANTLIFIKISQILHIYSTFLRISIQYLLFLSKTVYHEYGESGTLRYNPG